jgi:hypothetical protein
LNPFEEGEQTPFDLMGVLVCSVVPYRLAITSLDGLSISDLRTFVNTFLKLFNFYFGIDFCISSF